MKEDEKKGKISDFNHFCKLKNEYLKICNKVDVHNRTHNAEDHEFITKVNYAELYQVAKRYPSAKLIIEVPNQQYLSENSNSIKYLFSLDPEKTIQPMIPFKGIVANEYIIVLYVTECPDFKNFNNEEIKKHDHYSDGSNIVRGYEKLNKCDKVMNQCFDANIWGYWVEDFYFEKGGWKSVYNGDKNFVNVFSIYRGNTLYDAILDPHY